MSKSVKFVKIVSPIALAIALSACGGGSTSFGSGGDDTVQEVQARSIELSVSSRQLVSDGSSPITITAIAKNLNNNAIDGADIIFSVDKDATILKNATVTTTVDPDDPAADPVTVVTSGSVQTATLTPGSPTNQTLNVTVSSGGVSKTISVDVVGTSVTINGPDAITLGKDNPFFLKLNDSSNNPIAFEAVEITSANGNTISTDSNFETNAAGEIAFTVNGAANGTDTIAATVLGASYSKNVEISADEFALSNPTEEININTGSAINFVWTKNGVPQAGKTIILSATRGDISNQTAVTNGSGVASFVISSKTAGQTVITATSTDGLSTTLLREFVAITPAYLNTQAAPTLIAPNAASTIIAKIRDINDNPVKNKTIDFRLEDTVDGTLSSSTAMTDSLGRASIAYTAGNSSSATNGVKITTFIQGYPGVSPDEVTLTVGGDALRIVLGEDELLAEDEVFYIKQFGVIVTDSAGNPIKDQAISFTISPIGYYKGFMRVVDTDGDGEADAWSQYHTVNPVTNFGSLMCISEDFDNDGNLDAGEDINGNGTLEPTHDAAVTGSGVTDENGKIVVEVVYPQSRALWSKQRITAKTQVEGTEFVEQTDFTLGIISEDVNNVDSGVPNALSPYGYSDRCDTDNNIFNVPVTSQVVDVLAGAATNAIENNIWYTVRFVDALGNVISDRSFTVTSSVATVETGPNNTFRLSDNNEAVDSSGYYIVLSSGGVDQPLFYLDEEAVEPTAPPAPAADDDAPIVTLNGSPTMTLNLGDTYTELSANAVDAVDGVRPISQMGAVPVDASDVTTTAGTYTIIYSASDTSGNTNIVTRTVTVNP